MKYSSIYKIRKGQVLKLIIYYLVNSMHSSKQRKTGEPLRCPPTVEKHKAKEPARENTMTFNADRCMKSHAQFLSSCLVLGCEYRNEMMLLFLTHCFGAVCKHHWRYIKPILDFTINTYCQYRRIGRCCQIALKMLSIGQMLEWKLGDKSKLLIEIIIQTT